MGSEPIFDPENPEWTEADFAAAKGPESLPPAMLAAFPRTKPAGRLEQARRFDPAGRGGAGEVQGARAKLAVADQ